MSKIHRSAPVFFRAKDSQIDPSTGVISGIVIIQGGPDKYGDNWDSKALEQIITLGNLQTAGVKSRYGHPNICDSTLGSYLGRYKNFRLGTTSRTDGGITKDVPCALADLHLDPVAKQSPKGNLFDYVLTMSQRNADMFGNSIVYHPDDAELVMETTEEGQKKEIYYQRVKSLPASDLVDSPAATDNLFKESTDFAAQATAFLDENPQIYEILENHPEVMREFLQKYSTHKNPNNKMKNEKSKSLVQKALGFISQLIGKDTTMIETADGNMISVNCADGTEPAVGDAVSDEAGNPLVNAEIPLKDGQKITTDQTGAISEITPADGSAVAAPDPEPAADPAAESLESLQEEKKIWLQEKKSLEDQLTEKQAQLDEASQELTELQKSYEQMTVKLEFIAKNTKSTAHLNPGRQNFSHTPATVQMSKEERKAKIKGDQK